MARVHYGSIVTKIEGSLGGHTFQANSYGHTVRNKPIPLRPNTSDQMLIKRYLISTQNAWQLLSNSNRAIWNQFAIDHPQYSKHNISAKLSGYALFLKYNQIRQTAGLAILTTIVSSSWSTTGITYGIVNVGSVLYVRFSQNLAPANTYFLLKLSGKLKPSQMSCPNQLRIMPPSSNEDPNFPISVPYIAKYSAIPAIMTKIYSSIQYFCLDAPFINAQLAEITLVVGE